MIPPYPFRYYRTKLPAPENEEASKSHRRRFARLLASPFGGESPLLCQACHDRKLDFRPLVRDPPEVPPTYPYDSVEDDILIDLEMKNAVHIHGFLLEEAKATQSHCSLCRLLIVSLNEIWKEGWLLNMRCTCILRPRYDCFGHGREKSHRSGRFKIVHRNQLFVEFQPMEEEVVFDLGYDNKLRPARKGRVTIPAVVNTKMLRSWLRQCDEKHSHSPVPSSLLSRIQALLDRKLFRVINTSTGLVEIHTSLPKFVALSYVWGSAPDQSNYRPLESRPISAYAPTIRDAAAMARLAGFEWLWVDRICIDQSSETEKAAIIPYMKDIYAAAELTIVAGCGDGAQSGLLGSPESPRKPERRLVIGPSISVLGAAEHLHFALWKSAWNKRGWTFEEYVFSRRLLFVLNSEIFFSCGEYTFRESSGRRPIVLHEDKVDRGLLGETTRSGTERLHKGLRNNPANMSEVLDMNNFLSALKEYSTRNLKFVNDKVPAFAGVIIAALTSPVDEVLERELLKHGHPLRFFEVLLTWRYRFEWSKSSGEECGHQPPPIMHKPYAPSWSWASSPVEICFDEACNYLIHHWDFPWFQYTLLQNHDILALPTRYNLTACVVGLELPDGLVTGQPWMNNVSNGLPLGHEGRLSPDTFACNLPALPSLHVVTLVFDARLAYWEEKAQPLSSYQKDNYILLPRDGTETIDEVHGVYFDMLDEWSLSYETKCQLPPDPVGPRPHPFETFALITGRAWFGPAARGQYGPDYPYFDLYIMFLDPTGQDDTYRRIGMTRLSKLGQGSHFVDVIKQGRPRWQYIRII